MPRQSMAYKAYRESSRFAADVAAGKIAGQGGVPRGITTVTSDKSYKARRAQKAGLAVPKAVTDIAASPFTGGIGAVTDLWTMALGSREDKVNTAMDYMPVNDVTRKTVTNTVDYSASKSPSAGAFWGQSVIGASDTPTSSLLPDIGGDLKQTIIIAGLFLGGIYLAGKILGGKK